MWITRIAVTVCMAVFAMAAAKAVNTYAIMFWTLMIVISLTYLVDTFSKPQ